MRMLAARFALLLIIITAPALILTGCGGDGSGQGGRGGKGAAGFIGGPFELIDHHGHKVTEKSFRGKYMLIYFGYTHCPQICPTSLQTMSEAMENLGPLADRITPVFITVDPERDKPEVIADYISNFDPRFVGLTGSPKQIERASKAYRVYSKKVEEDGRTDFNHSAIVFLMDPNGRYAAHFAYGVDGQAMAERIREILNKAGGGKNNKGAGQG